MTQSLSTASVAALSLSKDGGGKVGWRNRLKSGGLPPPKHSSYSPFEAFSFNNRRPPGVELCQPE